MKNKYDLLNDIQMNFDEYEDYVLTSLESANMKENMKTKKKISYKKVAILAACVASVAVISQTAFAQNFISNIIKTISTGHNEFIQMEESYLPTDGMKFAAENNDNIKVSSTEDEIECFSTEDINEVSGLANFKFGMPEYLPEGYEFANAEMYYNEDKYYSGDRTVGGDYVTFNYKNADGDEMHIFERRIDETTSFSASFGGELKEVTVNGNVAALQGSTISWENEGVSYTVIIRDVSEEELIKVAESVR